MSTQRVALTSAMASRASVSAATAVLIRQRGEASRRLSASIAAMALAMA
jgi:hypothetical protein